MPRTDYYPKLLKMKLSEAQLRMNHYPRPDSSVPGKAVIHNIQSSFFKVSPSNSQRNCKRCFKVYEVMENGQQKKLESCSYHPHRPRGKPPKFLCCQGNPNAKPCSKASKHITSDIDPDNLTDFIHTKNNTRVNTQEVYAIDCEMICTTAGLELASISVVDVDGNLVYETMVLPENPIIDYQTEHSNLRERDFRVVTAKLKDVHEKLLSLFCDNTILVGHGLENDFLRLKLFHSTIVDTAILYPNPNGRTNSLKFLRERYLPRSKVKTNIPKSRDDAQATMKLALRKCF